MDNNFDYHNKVQSHNNFLYNNLELNDDNEDHEVEGNNAAYDVEVEGNDDLLTYGEEVGPYVEDDVYDVGVHGVAVHDGGHDVVVHDVAHDVVVHDGGHDGALNGGEHDDEVHDEVRVEAFLNLFIFIIEICRVF